MKLARTGLAVTAALTVFASACSSSDEPTKEPESGPDFAEVHELWHEYNELDQTVSTARNKLSATTKTHLESHPDAKATDAELTKALDAVELATADRQAVLDKIADSEAVNAPELKEQWGALAPALADYNTFADGFFEDQSTLQVALRRCKTLIEKIGGVDLKLFDFQADERLRAFEKYLPACQEPMKELTGSANSQLKAYSTGIAANLEKRHTLLKEHAAEKIDLETMVRRYVALGENDLTYTMDIQGTMNSMFPRAQMGAFDKAVHAAPGVDHAS